MNLENNWYYSITHHFWGHNLSAVKSEGVSDPITYIYFDLVIFCLLNILTIAIFWGLTWTWIANEHEMSLYCCIFLHKRHNNPWRREHIPAHATPQFFSIVEAIFAYQHLNAILRIKLLSKPFTKSQISSIKRDEFFTGNVCKGIKSMDCFLCSGCHLAPGPAHSLGLRVAMLTLLW